MAWRRDGACAGRGHPFNGSPPTMTHPNEHEPTSYILIHSHAFSYILMHSHASHTFTHILLLSREECVCLLKNDMWEGMWHVSPYATRLMEVSLQ